MTKEKECVGSYEVSGYTRQDGTEVSGYTRRCGAKHVSQDDKYEKRADVLYPSMNKVLQGGVEYDYYPEENEPQEGEVEGNEYPEEESPENGASKKEIPQKDKNVDLGKIFEKVAKGVVNVKTTPLLGQSKYDVQNTKIPESSERRIARQEGDIGQRSQNRTGNQQGNGKTQKDFEKIANVLYPTMSDNKMVETLKEKGKQELSEIEKERWKEHAKNFGGATIELASAFIPGTAQFKLATIITKALTPKLGRVLAQEVATGIVKGAISGGTYGVGDGMLNDEDLLFNVLENATLGATTGGSLGLTVGKGTQIFKGIKLKDFKPINDMTSAEKKEFRKFAKKYYQDYLQGKSIKSDELGRINLTAKGALETLNKNIEAGKDFPALSRKIQNSKYVKSTELYKKRDDHFNKFHILEGENELYIIATDENGHRYYLTKKK